MTREVGRVVGVFRSVAPVRRLLGVAIRRFPYASVTAAVAGGLAVPLTAMGLGWLVESVATGGSSLKGGAVLVAGFATGGWAARVGTFTQTRAGEEWQRNLFEHFARTLETPTTVAHYESPRHAHLLRMMTYLAQRAVTPPVVLGTLVTLPVQLVAAILVMASVGPTAMLLVIGGIPAVVVTATAASRHQRAMGRATVPLMRSEALLVVLTDPRAAKDLRTNQWEKSLATEHHALRRAAQRILLSAVRREILLESAAWTTYAAVGIGALAMQADPGPAGARAVVTMVALLAQLRAPLVAGAQAARSFGDLRALAAILSEFERLVSDRVVLRSWKLSPHERGPLVEMNGGGFSYDPARPPALSAADFRVDRGTFIAVVGPNGAGKSTIVSALCALYDLDEGTITASPSMVGSEGGDVVRGRDIWPNLSACFQSFGQYELSLAENVVLGADVPSSVAADWPAMVPLFLGLQDLDPSGGAGLDVLLGKTSHAGSDLSEGQWQRVALARAMIRANRTLVVYDEPGAHLDPIAESEVVGSLKSRGQGTGLSSETAVVLVTHRLGLARLADEIVVVERGQVTQRGSHEELMRERGSYYEHHFRSQASAFR